MLTKNQLTTITSKLNTIEHLEFAYLHGSAVKTDKYHDIDIALFINPAAYNAKSQQKSITFDLILPLERELENLLLISADVQILNNAPLAFRYKVANSNLVLLDNNIDMREQFELLSRVEYYDFRPKALEYLREALI